MASRLTILDELNQISPLVAGIGAANPYTVPEGYFEAFSELLMARIKVERLNAKEELEMLSPLLSSISRKVPYEMPANYFSELSDHALGGAKAIDFVNEELENLSPLMNSLKGKSVYEAPEGYFDTLADQILAEAKKQKPAKVVAFRPVKKIMRYAVAAVVIGVMAISVWLSQREPGKPSIAKIENGIEAASDEEILNFIQSSEAPLAETVLTSDDEMSVADMKVMLADVSDKELEQFVNESLEQNHRLSN